VRVVETPDARGRLEDLRGQVELRIVDVAEDPVGAAEDRILAVPSWSTAARSPAAETVCSTLLDRLLPTEGHQDDVYLLAFRISPGVGA